MSASMTSFARPSAQGGHAETGRSRLFAWSAGTVPALIAAIDSLRPGSPAAIADGCAERAHVSGARLALAAATREDFDRKLRQARERLVREPDRAFALPSGVYFTPAAAPRPKIAWLFPGQGSQYRDMLSDLLALDPGTSRWFEALDRRLLAAGREPPSRAVWGEEAAASDTYDLYRLGCGGLAVLVADLALADLARRLAIPCDGMLGHSNGEMSALLASRALRPQPGHDPLDVLAQISAAFEAVDSGAGALAGQTAAITATDRPAVDRVLEAWSGRVHVMLDNCPQQIVVFAAAGDLPLLSAELQATGALVTPTPFGRAYHTPLMSAHREMFMSFYAMCDLGPGEAPLYSASTARLFPPDSAGIAEVANGQWYRTVRFGDAVRGMYEDGYRIFLEVGPAGRLSGFVRSALRGVPHRAISLDREGRPGSEQLCRALAELFAAHVDMDLQQLDLQQRPRQRAPASAAPRSVVRALAGEHFRLMREAVDAEARGFGRLAGALRRSAHRTPVAGVGEGQSRAGTQPAAAWPGIRNIVRDGNERLRAEFTLSAADPYLRDHTFARTPSRYQPELIGLPVLPFCMSLEAVAQLALLTIGEARVVVGIDDARGHKWITIDHTSLTLVADTCRIPPGPEGFEKVAVSLHEVRQEPGGTAFGDKLFEATVLLASAYPQPRTARSIEPPPLPSVLKRSLPDYVAELLFHGPTYKLLDELVGLDADGVTATCRAQAQRRSVPTAIPGPVLDLPGQLAAYWYSETSDDVFTMFPVHVGALRFYAPPPAAGTQLRAAVSVKRAGGLVRGEITIATEAGEALLTAKNWSSRVIDVPLDVFKVLLWPSGRDPLIRPVAVGGHTVWRLDGFDPGFLESANGIWKRSLAKATLCAAEHERWSALPSRGPGRLDRLLGAIAAKEAARLHIAAAGGIALDLADLAVAHDRRGAPSLQQIAGPGVDRLPGISISHSQGEAAAMLAPPGTRVGLDIARGQPPSRESAWLEQAFEADDLALIRENGCGDRLFDYWMAKEAAAKAVGTGLLGAPRRWRIVDAGRQVAEVAIAGVTINVALAEEAGLRLAVCLMDETVAVSLAERLMPSGSPPYEA